ncbi:hypothetical protein VUJ46_19115 [Chryseobacterium sp. MYb264]|uniref:hypothetical protein n=1 Tax=Chryseobacterium sp. MYb264 TaxID=2745153 RepID=UPI002E0DCAEF|nr:hypothetical protein VUJ46_19115 [Chryseobacterium sp. MYb264]
MIKFFSLISLLSLSFCLNAQVGIQTSQVHPSAILELNTASLPTGSKKGFLGPRVSLTGSRDTQTIPSPAVGLLVYNLSTAGTFPDNVHPNRYYYWNGTEWVDFGVTTVLESFLAYRVMSLNATSSQTFTYNDINATSAANGGIPISFSDTDMVVNTGNIATKSGNTFKINITGLYEISGYVNYNPNRTSIGSPQRGCFLNLKLQLSNNNGSTWTDVIGNRTAWGVRTNNLLKTATLISTPINLTAGQMVRMVVQNPFGVSDTSSIHGENPASSPDAPLPSIASSTRTPISKNLTLTLLDYDIQQ